VKLVPQDVVLVNLILITVLVVLVSELNNQLVDVQTEPMKKQITLVSSVNLLVSLVPMLKLVIPVTLITTDICPTNNVFVFLDTIMMVP
jgi:hypothetical protein